MFQRFSFENQSPERKEELLEKQRKQQQQRDILLHQIEARKREKNLEKERNAQRELQEEQRYNEQFSSKQANTLSQSQTIQPSFQHASTVDFSKNGRNSNANRTQPAIFPIQNYTLLPERTPGEGQVKSLNDRQMLSMTLTPNTIHNAFASLRHQIMSTAASTVITSNPVSRSPPPQKIHQTF